MRVEECMCSLVWLTDTGFSVHADVQPCCLSALMEMTQALHQMSPSSLCTKQMQAVSVSCEPDAFSVLAAGAVEATAANHSVPAAVDPAANAGMQVHHTHNTSRARLYVLQCPIELMFVFEVSLTRYSSIWVA